MKERLFKNPITSILGLVVILASIASVFLVKSIGWEGASVGITAGTTLLFFKDKKSDGAALLLALLIALLFIGCASPPALTTGNKESYKETYKEVQVAVPGGVVNTSLSDADLNAIKTALQQGKDTVVITDPTNKAALKFYLDALGNLRAECESKDQLITYLQKEIEKERSSIKTITKTITETPVWCWVVMGFLLAAAFIFGTLFQIQRLK